ncbi:MAG: hypothetical protein A3F84_14725 [Candidatus Handelsmanbacteria bacterium RIFCSPLOWO2_12_FULL_64_10]|uniref:histidine kinase n=1 Tax=Handelsmanbacteria sp. (strain RIFCSPLOWO2_12_FULL_64_10) TaxID=1817868 RepID=A0A1F6CZ41_HANXR|nr:MAG: hypothetical protein A3F84_14725 [Candidatus Handelsmanbacteria bacterium RIFCSPLOWO2_12_FULL_64_10]
MAKILIVDDVSTNRELLVTLLGYGGHRLIEASDGAEALDITRAERPDLVIADILMPTMDGYEFVRRLRQDADVARTPVIYYTANYHMAEAKRLAKAAGVHYLLVKPVDPQVVLSTVEAALGTAESAPLAPPPEVPEAFDREHLRLVTDTLSQKVNELEVANQRLGRLIEVGQQLGSEKDPIRLLVGFCHAARELIGARHAAIGVLDGTGETWRYFFTAGIDAETSARLGAPPVSQGIFAGLLRGRRPLRGENLNGKAAAASFLGAPVSSPTRPYGILYLGDRLGLEAFTEQDEQLVATLAAQIAIAYENAQRLDEIQRHAADLEIEVAERKRAEEAVRRLNVELERKNVDLQNVVKELEGFSYSVAHDLRAPLRAVIGYAAATLEDYGDRLDEEGRHYLDTIRDSAKDMGQLIDDLLNFSRLGRQQMAPAEVDVAGLARGVCEDLRRAEPGRVLRFEVGALPSAWGDRAMVRQVLVNLLSNAVKFTRPREQAVISVGGSDGDGENTYFVRDNGVGFDIKYVDKLFGVFQRLHAAGEFEGTGIGLSIVRRIVHRHGGRVWAEGAVGRGATFYFTIPEEKTHGNRS